MKKRAAAVLTALCLLAALLPGETAHAVTDVCFVSVNDRLLELSSKAENIGGGWYVPCTAFSEFGINYNYFSSSSTAMLFTSKKQFFFELGTGVTYDASDNRYSASGALVNGVAYVPVNFVCAQFGLAWAYIVGNGSGDICRIKDSAAELSDDQFLSAAVSQMAEKYAAYMSVVNPVTSAATPSAQPVGARTVYLSFQGLPSAGVLDALDTGSFSAAFFLTAAEIRADPATVRRLVGAGHTVGILCQDYETYSAAAALLYEAGHVMTVLVAAPEGGERACKAMAEKNGLVYCGYTIDAVRGGKGLEYSGLVTSQLTARENYVRILCGDAATKNIRALVGWLRGNNCSVLPDNEIHHG